MTDQKLQSANKLAYMGSKLRFADQLIKLWPQDCTSFVESFGGMGIMAQIAAALPKRWKKIRYNDFGEHTFNLIRVIRNHVDELRPRLTVPIDEEMYNFCGQFHRSALASDVERAWRLLVALNHSEYMSGGRLVGGPGGRAPIGYKPLKRFKRMQWHVDKLSALFQRMEISNDDGIEVIKETDGHGIFQFVDPPYLDKVRTEWEYEKELTDDMHQRLVTVLLGCKSRVCLCGYPNPIYDKQLTRKRGWRRVTLKYYKHNKEKLWMNY